MDEIIKCYYTLALAEFLNSEHAVESIKDMDGISNAVKSIAASNIVLVEYLCKIDNKLDIIIKKGAYDD